MKERKKVNIDKYFFFKMEELNIIIKHKHGLHARPASEIVKMLTNYSANVCFKHKDKIADGKSILQLLLLGAAENAKITITSSGIDANKAITSLKNYFNNYNK